MRLFENLNKSDLTIKKEVPIKPGKSLDADKDLGDIDVLVISHQRKQIVCIEAKNYVESRTGYELYHQKAKIDEALKKVEPRHYWCKNNVIKFKKIDSEVNETYSVKTIYLTYNENAYNYFDHSLGGFCKFMSFTDIIAAPMIIFD